MPIIRNYWNRLISIIHSADGIFIAVGITAVFAGVLVDVFLVRLLCLFIVIGTAGMLYLSMRFHPGGGTQAHEETRSPFRLHLESNEMKKLLFDDFQSDSSSRYRVEEIDHHESVFGPIPEPSPVPSPGEEDQMPQNVKVIKPEAKPVAHEFQISDFFDIDSDIFTSDAEPRTEFDFLLNKVLSLVKDVVFAHSVVFFWANREKRHMVMEARLTDSTTFMTPRRFQMGYDLVSRVAESGKPEMVTDVNPLSEHELFPYYDTPPGVKSFAGVPVFFTQASSDSSASLPVAVLVVDSKVEGAFGDETLSLLGQFTKLISALIKNYTDKYDLLLDSEVLSSIKRFQERVRNDFSIATILQFLPEEASRLVSWDFLSVILYDENKHAWTVKKLMNRAYEPYIAPEQRIDFPDSIVGNTIRNNIHYVVDNLSTMPLPRYYNGEEAKCKGSFLSLPICSINKCYGALTVESREPDSFTRREIKILSRLTEPAAMALDLLSTNDIIREYVIVDAATGVHSRKFFFQKIDEELQRADDGGLEASLLQITVDHASELVHRHGQDGFDHVIATLAKAIRSSIRSYDIVGRLDNNRFGVMLVNTAANEAYLWAEKIRENVAAHVINYEGKSFSITISVGVAGALEGMRKEELLTNASTVLGKASEAGGNTVRVF